MKRDEFVLVCTKIFQEHGFLKKGRNFYREFGNDIMMVFGLDKLSSWDYFFVEPGFIFQSINSRMPYPKFNYADLRCDSVRIEGTDRFYYEKLSESQLREAIIPIILTGIQAGRKGTEELVRTYIDTNKYFYISSKKVAEYLGVAPETPRIFQLDEEV